MQTSQLTLYKQYKAANFDDMSYAKLPKCYSNFNRLIQIIKNLLAVNRLMILIEQLIVKYMVSFRSTFVSSSWKCSKVSTSFSSSSSTCCCCCCRCCSVSDDKSSSFPADGSARRSQHSRHNLRPQEQTARLHSLMAQDQDTQD